MPSATEDLRTIMGLPEPENPVRDQEERPRKRGGEPPPREATAVADILPTLTHDTEEGHTALTAPSAGGLGVLNAGTWWPHPTPALIGGSVGAGALAHCYGVSSQRTRAHESDGTIEVIGPAAGDHSAQAVRDSALPIAAARCRIGELPERMNDPRVLAGVRQRQWEPAGALFSHGRPAVPCR